MVVRDLRTGKVLHRESTGTPSASSKDIGVGATVAIVVKSDGAVAWINVDELSYQAHAVDKTGSRLLASGSDIARIPSRWRAARSTGRRAANRTRRP